LKIFLIILLSISSLFSFDALQVKAEIISKIAHEFVHKDVVNICTDDKDLLKTKGLVSSVNYTTMDKADIVFVSDINSISKNCNTKYIFSTSYYLYENSTEVLGVFFWQKGRPNIIIKSSMLKKSNIKLSQAFQKYVE
jgi:hypothetical protein